MNTIMFATDFSERSDRALRRATLLARQCSARLSIVHVVDDDQPRRIVESEQDIAERLLVDQVATVRDTDGVNCNARVVLAAPFEGIVKATEDDPPGLLVIGAHRRKALRDIFVGTTAERTIRAVHCPVLMANAPPVSQYRNVLLTTDLSPASASAIEQFSALGVAPDARTSVLYAYHAAAAGLTASRPLPRDDREYYLRREQENAASELSQFFAESGTSPGVQIARHSVNSPVNEILAVVGELGADLVVVGTRGKSGFARLILGSVAEGVLRNATIDVLAIPPVSPG